MNATDPDAPVKAADYPGLDQRTCDYVNRSVRPEWRHSIASALLPCPDGENCADATCARLHPLTEAQRSSLSEFLGEWSECELI